MPKPEYTHHDWNATEADVVDGLEEDLREAWEKLRAFAAALGPQRIYASPQAIMFSKKVCYFFVRPKKKWLEVFFFLPREVDGLKTYPVSKTREKYSNMFKLVHADQVEEPLTDWIREAYEFAPEAGEKELEKPKPKKSPGNDWRFQMLDKVRAIIKEAAPGAVEEYKWRGIPVWSDDGIICTGETYKSVVKLTFPKGASLKDPARLFNSSLEGRARRAIDIREGEKLNSKALKNLVRAAAVLNKSSRKTKASKKSKTSSKAKR
jgi:hypothetical protein